MNGIHLRTFVLFMILVFQACTIISAHSGESNVSSPEGTFSVKDFGAQGDGQTDDTSAIQKSIDAAAEKGGQVYLPPGKYLVKGSLNVKTGVALKGAHEAPLAIEPLIGSIVMATGGRDNEKAPALFEMGHSSTVKGLTVWYPEQKPTDIHPYPWTFHLTGFDNTVEDITLINSYNGICVGPESNVRHRIRSVYGCVLRRGLFVDGCTDIGRVENVQFHCHWWSAKSIGGDWEPVYKYMYENCEAFVFGRTDWEYVTNNFVFPAKIGFRFIKTERGACNGQFTGNGADACETSVLVEEIQPMGLLITGGQFVAFNGENPIELVVAESCTGSVRLVNCAFWGPSNHNAVLEGKGFVSFNDCYFSNWKEGTEETPLIVAKSGRLQINNSSFATEQPSVELGPELKHAIIQGNNGINGVRVINHAKRAIITNNEERSGIADKQTYLSDVVNLLEREWPHNRTVTIVAHGHSVPAGYFKTPMVDTFNAYPHLLHRALKAKFPYAVINVVVTAIGGENSESGAKRFERDALALNPDVLSIDYALNDRGIGLERAEKAWREIIEKAMAKDIKVILLTPAGDASASLDDPNDPLNRHAAQIRKLAEEYHVGLVDSLQTFKRYIQQGGELGELMSQVNHPNRRGHELVARELFSWFESANQAVDGFNDDSAKVD